MSLLTHKQITDTLEVYGKEVDDVIKIYMMQKIQFWSEQDVINRIQAYGKAHSIPDLDLDYIVFTAIDLKQYYEREER